MRAIRSFFIAVSLYSQIPVPQFAWKEEDMRYVFCFFPWIGAGIGLCVYFWNELCNVCRIGALCRSAVGTALPLLITGGFHADGFMDTMDAIHSYREKERKLEILKDSHIGAFAVITFAAYGLVFAGAFSEIESKELVEIACGSFFLSRCLCGISALSFPPAKRDGTLRLVADSSRKRFVQGFLYLQSAACIGFMVFCSVIPGLLAAAAGIFALGYYRYHSEKEFGGITGDTAGYFVLLSEICMIMAVAAWGILRG